MATDPRGDRGTPPTYEAPDARYDGRYLAGHRAGWDAAEAARAEVAEPGDVSALSVALQRAGVLSKSHMTYADTARCVVAALNDGRDDRGAPDVHWSHDVPAATAGREPLDALREALQQIAFMYQHETKRPASFAMEAGRIAVEALAALDTPDPGAS